MNRIDRKMTEINDIMELISRVKFCAVAVNDGGTPYVVPISYGYEFSEDDSILTLYFHCAKKGKKSYLWLKNGKASFSIASMDGLIEGEKACDYSCNYASVIGSGSLRQLSDPDEMAHGLEKIMENQTGDKWTIKSEETKGVALWKLCSSDFTGKHRI